MKAKKSVLALTLGLGLALLGSVPPAQAAVVTDQEDATLLSRGVAVTGTYTVTCPEGDVLEVYTSLAQRVGGGRVASGSSADTVWCTGEAQEVAYTAQTFSGVAFKSGTALLTVTVVDCSEFGCFLRSETSEEIRLAKK
jgi:hypothetical protein